MTQRAQRNRSWRGFRAGHASGPRQVRRMSQPGRGVYTVVEPRDLARSERRRQEARALRLLPVTRHRYSSAETS